MFLKKTPTSNGRIRLSIVDGYYDKTTKKTKHKVIESLGFLDELEKQYDDPIDYFNKRAAILNKEKQGKRLLSTLLSTIQTDSVLVMISERTLGTLL